MTPQDDFIAAAASQVGTTEDPPRSNRQPYGAWYGDNGVEWCAQFVSWCAWRANIADLVPKFEWTPAGAAWFQSRRQFGRTPVKGAVVFYDFGLGRVSHTGIVESVTAAGWTAIEGNSSNAVMRRPRTSVGGLGGFGYPAWTSSPTARSAPYGGVVLRRGSAGGAVRAVQDALNGWLATQNSPPIHVDGLFGPATERAVRGFQSAHGLAVDGQIGQHTWPALIH